MIGPPQGDVLSLLAAQGELREAIDSPAALRSIERRRSAKSAAEIVADVQGRW